MNTEQHGKLRRITRALDHRYMQVNGALRDGIESLETLSNRLDADHPAIRDIDSVLRLLTRATNESAELQSIVADVLHRQINQARSAKKAYEQGWEARVLDLLAHATPEQATILRQLLLDIDGEDDDLPF